VSRDGASLASVCSLRAATPAAWAGSVLPHLAELLVEQAHLEKKAAAAASSFLFRIPSVTGWQKSLSQLAREELVHFERTLRILQERGIELGQQAPSPYAESLKSVRHAHMPQRLLDELVISAVIEARSHERMQMLAHALADTDAPAAAFYDGLVEAEERHHGDYLEIAAGMYGRAAVLASWDKVAQHEANVLASLPFLPRLHGGWGTLGALADGPARASCTDS
jgi:tRNA-(ms[2]io[6]A)-hydroxylase